MRIRQRPRSASKLRIAAAAPSEMQPKEESGRRLAAEIVPRSQFVFLQKKYQVGH
jgi:hypothetical protein